MVTRVVKKAVVKKPIIKRKPVVIVKKVVKTPVKRVVNKVVKKPVVKRVVKRVVVRKPVVKRIVKKAPAACQIGVLNGVNFLTDSATLTNGAKSTLVRVAKKLKNCRLPKLVLVGHTDNVGSDQYNLGLSQRRVNSVKAFLVKQGILARRLGTAGKGESQPRATNKTEQGRAANRRVELRTL